MSGKLSSKFKNFLGIGDEDDIDEDDYERYEEDEKKKQQAQQPRSSISSYSGSRDVSAKTIKTDRERSARMKAEAAAHGADSTQKVHTVSNYDSTTYLDSKNNAKQLRMERTQGSRVFPINTTRLGNEVCIMKPVNFEDSQDICDVLLANRIAIINLESVENGLAQRIMDFVSGSVYTMNGKLYPIHGLIFIVTPESVDISGDYNELIEQSGFDVPILR